MTDTDFLRPSVARATGYNARHDPAEVVLDANESPYDLPEPVKEETFERLSDVDYNRYPDSETRALRTSMGEYLGVSPERLVAGNGSDELIGYLLTACVEPGDTVLVPSPTFSMYEILGEQFHANVETVPLKTDWSLPEEFIDRARDAKLIFVGSPNNPTGNCFETRLINRLIEEASGLVVLDEAYAEFSDRSLLDRVGDNSSLVVLRTLSKAFGLAAARVGFLCGPEAIVRGVNTVRLPYNLNTLSAVTAEETLKHRESVLNTVDNILSERDELVEFLDEAGLNPSPTDANFILFKPDSPDTLYENLLDEGVRIRSFSGGPVEEYLRVTVGTTKENECFKKAVNDSLSSV